MSALEAAGGVAAIALVGLVAFTQLRDRKRRKLDTAVPDVLDLLVLCSESGLGLDASLRHVTKAISELAPELAKELEKTNTDLQSGVARDIALRGLGMRTGVEDLRDLAEVLLEVDALGTSVGESLRRHADATRRKRRERARRKAASLPTKMSIILPAFFLTPLLTVIVAPIILEVYEKYFDHHREQSASPLAPAVAESAHAVREAASAAAKAVTPVTESLVPPTKPRHGKPSRSHGTKGR